jgi:2-polyprenyl-3-methyl-5-hydroxy-6-metoxy-1,4-benzoquinol methylase
MKNRNADPAGHKNACERVATRFHSRVLRGYVASKLRTDPVYAAVYELTRASAEPLLDVGCGLGLLAFYLRERGFQNPIIGLDRDPRKIREANRIAEAFYEDLDFREQDLREQLPPFAGIITVLDVLHYLAPSEQKNLLGRFVERVAPGAILVLRDCPRDSGLRYWLTYLAEKFAQAISWNMAVPLHFPSGESIFENFPPNEFTRNSHPLWGATPFNNHLFTFRRHAHAVARVAE